MWGKVCVHEKNDDIWEDGSSVKIYQEMRRGRKTYEGLWRDSKTCSTWEMKQDTKGRTDTIIQDGDGVWWYYNKTCEVEQRRYIKKILKYISGRGRSEKICGKLNIKTRTERRYHIKFVEEGSVIISMWGEMSQDINVGLRHDDEGDGSCTI